MGGVISTYSSTNESAEGSLDSVSRLGLGDILESCIVLILERLDPLEICKLAQLNRAFRDASSCETLWKSKLPSNYMFLVERVLGEHAGSLSKKEVYARLCRPNGFDGGSKVLKITGIDDRRYWNHIPTDESRFNTVAYLQQIWWVELVGEIKFQFALGTYSLFFRLKLGSTPKRFGRRVCDLDRVHGWDVKPVRYQVSTLDGQGSTSECYLHDPGSWVHYPASDFVDSPNRPVTVKFSMVPVWILY